MEKQKIKLVFRRGSTPLKIAITAVVLLSIATLLVIWVFKEQAREDYQDHRDEAATLEQENARLKTYIDQLGTIRGIAQIAKEELGLVDPDTIIIEPEQ